MVKQTPAEKKISNVSDGMTMIAHVTEMEKKIRQLKAQANLAAQRGDIKPAHRLQNALHLALKKLEA